MTEIFVLQITVFTTKENTILPVIKKRIYIGIFFSILRMYHGDQNTCPGVDRIIRYSWINCFVQSGLRKQTIIPIMLY